MSYIRPLDIHLPPGQSAFLWGARQTGESTYLRERFPDSVYLDLLDFDVRLPLSARPTRLGEQLEATSGTREAPVIIDEIPEGAGIARRGAPAHRLPAPVVHSV